MALPYIDTYYRDTLNHTIQRPLLNETKRADVCVIGGGLAGLSTAMSLCERGKTVCVVEANKIGWGASGRNGGFVAGGYARDYHSLVRKIGLGPTRELHRIATAGRALITQRIAAHGIECGPVVAGQLAVSWHDRPGAMEDYAAFMAHDMGVKVDYWTSAQVHDVCRSARYYDGCFFPEDFQFHPLNYVLGLAGAIERTGGAVYEATPALGIDGQEGHYTVTTPQGAVECDQVVVSCSAYIGGLERRIKQASFPVRTYVMVTAPILPDILDQAITQRYAIYDTRFADDYYRRLADGRILWGGRVALSDSSGNVAQKLRHDLLKIYPQLEAHLRVDYAWAGDMCYAPHKMPQVGQMRPGYWYCSAFGGHGMVPTAACGDVVAAAIASGDETYRAFEPFSALHFAGGPLSPVVAQGVYYYWRLRDILGR